MSTKTIAVESGVYQRLALEKQESESFTKVIDRLLRNQMTMGTCGDAVFSAMKIWGTDERDREAMLMEQRLDEQRKSTNWIQESLG